jgi:single-strand DNA-binding protein
MPKYQPGQRLTLRGHLGYTPKLRHTDDGTPVTDFSLAVAQGHKENDEWVEDEPIWYKVTAWRKDAQQAVKNLKVGNRVMVAGKFKGESPWKTDGGEHRLDLLVDADEIAASIKFNDVSIQPAERSVGRGADSSTADGSGVGASI